MIKVSVIVPIYNVELYLEEALDSVINQTLEEIEIIVVNDGSTDSSLEIIKKYEKKDKRIKVVNQENQGLSGARNSGLKIAKGEYIYFMDSDDFISLDTLEICYNHSLNNRLDFIFFDAQSFTNDNIDISGYDYDRSQLIEEKSIFSGKEILTKLLNEKKYRSAAVLNFINLDYLTEIKLQFYPKIVHEDELFTFLLFLSAQKISYINRKFFNRRMRLGSIMTSSKSEKNIIGYLTVARELKKVLESEKDVEKIKLLNIRIVDIINNATGILNFLDKNLQNKYKMEIKSEFKNYLNIKSRIKLDYPNIFKIIIKIKEKVV